MKFMSFKNVAVLSLALIFCIFISNNNTVHANAEASSIKFGEAYTGVFKDDNNANKAYKITLPSDGNIVLSIKNKLDYSWEGRILNDKGEEVVNVITNDDSLVSGYATTQVGLPKGVYYVEVGHYSGYYGQKYEVKVDFTASNYYEKEFNNTIATANEMKLNQIYKGIVSDYGDEDYYKITLPSDGKVKLSVKQKSGYSWQGKILNNKGKEFTDVITSEESLVSGYASSEVGLPKGTYYVEVSRYGSEPGQSYEVKVDFTAGDFFEKEPNNTIATANTMKLNQTYKGIVKEYGDEDVYKFTLPSDGNVNLSIKNKSGYNWKGKVVDSKGKVYEDVVTDDSALISGYAKTQVGLPKGTYYVQVSNDYYYDGEAEYEIKTDFTESNYYEKEFNDSIDTANIIQLNKTYKGTIKDQYDNDIFKFAVPSTGDVTLSIKRKSEVGWEGHIQNSAGRKFNELSTYSKELKSGNAVSTATLKKGDYYFVMDGEYSSHGDQYEVKVSMRTTPLKASQVKVVNNTGKNDTVAVSGISSGDTIKVYSASKGGKPIASLKSKGGTVSLTAKQVGVKSGKIYVTVTKSGLSESNRVGIAHKGEKSNSLKTSQVKVKNNKGKNDTVEVSKIVKGDTIKVYSKSKGGKLLASKKSAGNKVTLSPKQIGAKSGKVYVTVIKSKLTESNRVAVSFNGEKSNSLKTAQVKVKNNKGKNDTIAVSKIAKGDTIKVYSKSKGGKLLASKKSAGTKVTLSPKQIGKKSGQIYVTVTKSKMSTSNRVAVAYKAER